MKLGIMQPYFFPYLGYFSLIDATDQWIVFDPVQYKRKAWINRNRVLKGDGGWQYIRVPVAKHSRDTLIKDIRVSADSDWQTKIYGQLIHYKKRAPYYNAVIDILKEIFSFEEKSISKLDARCLDLICQYLGIEFNYQIYSEMDIKHDHPTKPGEWALSISQTLNAKKYYNPPGGVEIFSPDQFSESGIELIYLDNRLSPYRQKGEEFEAGLSILDTLMFNSPSETLSLIRDVEVIKAN